MGSIINEALVVYFIQH